MHVNPLRLTTAAPSRAGARALVAATIGLGLALFPTSMLSALAVLVRRDLEFGEAQLGAVVAIFFGSSSVFSIAGGRLSDRVGPARALMIGGTGSGLSLLGIGLATSNWFQLAAFMVLGGAASAVIQTSAPTLLARRIPKEHQGLAYGVMLAGVPFAALLAGAALPLIALSAGWRLTFVVVSVATIGLLLAVPQDNNPATTHIMRPSPGRVSRRPLVILATGFGLASAAGTSVVPFIVEYATARGFDPAGAGILLTVASSVTILVRVSLGWLSDMTAHDSLIQVSSMLALSAISYALLAIAGPPVLLVGAMILAFGAGWGWPGLLVLGIVRTTRESPAPALAIVGIGTYLGGMTGPFIFGVLVEMVSYEAAWRFVAAMALAASAIVLVGRNAIMASTAAPGVAADIHSPRQTVRVQRGIIGRLRTISGRRSARR